MATPEEKAVCICVLMVLYIVEFVTLPPLHILFACKSQSFSLEQFRRLCSVYARITSTASLGIFSAQTVYHYFQAHTACMFKAPKRPY
jgi:hypothetical protein